MLLTHASSRMTDKTAKAPDSLRKRGRLRRAVAIGGFATSSARRLSKSLSKEQRAEMLAIAKDPQAWGDAIAKGWDVTKVEALEAGDAFVILSRVLLGRRVSREDRRIARDKLALGGTGVPPLRVFMLPGSEMLLGGAAAVMPWRLVPDRWIPMESLRGDEEKTIPQRSRLLTRHRQDIVDALED